MVLLERGEAVRSEVIVRDFMREAVFVVIIGSILVCLGGFLRLPTICKGELADKAATTMGRSVSQESHNRQWSKRLFL